VTHWKDTSLTSLSGTKDPERWLSCPRMRNHRYPGPLCCRQSIVCFVVFQHLTHVVHVDENVDGLDPVQKTPEHPVNCQQNCSAVPSQEKCEHSTDTVCGSVHVVRGRYEASRIRCDRRTAI
jgi:hypothetical protein